MSRARHRKTTIIDTTSRRRLTRAEKIGIGERVAVGGGAPGDDARDPRLVVGVPRDDVADGRVGDLGPLLRRGRGQVAGGELIDDVPQGGVGGEEELLRCHGAEASGNHPHAPRARPAAPIRGVRTMAG